MQHGRLSRERAGALMRGARWAAPLAALAAMLSAAPAALAQVGYGNEQFWTDVLKPSRRGTAPARRSQPVAPAKAATSASAAIVTGSISAAIAAGELPEPVKRAVPRVEVSGNELALEVGPAGRIPQPSAVAARAGSAMFAAHAELPAGTQLLVTDVTSGRAVLVTVAARQTPASETVIDLSPAAIEALGGRPPAQARLVVVWRPTGEPTFFPVVPFGRERHPIEAARSERAGGW